MKKKSKQALPFLTGMLTMALLMILTGAAMAASGNVSFNTASLSINGRRILAKDQMLTMKSGVSVPALIQYTDDQGNAIYYAPVRLLAESLGMEVSWWNSSRTINIEASGDAALYTMETHKVGATFNETFEEVEPFAPNSGKVLSGADHKSSDPYKASVPIDPKGGNYISFTVTNNGAKPVELRLGQSAGTAIVSNPTQVPAGETVTRTWKILDGAKAAEKPVVVEVSNPDSVTRTIDLSVAVAQF